MSLVEDPADYFAMGPSSMTFLSPSAAIGVCERAAELGYWVARVEGGFVRDGRFEARLDCIWDGKDNLRTGEDARRNNALAAEDIAVERERHDAFLVTLLPINRLA